MIYDHPLIGWVYRHSPVAAQHALVSAYGGLKWLEEHGRVFRGYVAELERTQWWPRADLKGLQEERLRALIEHAYAHVPYYRRVMDEHKLTPADIHTGGDLYKLPVLTKQDIRRHWDELRARNVPNRRVTMGRTGGTTGVPLKFTLDTARVIFDHALIYRHWSWAGFRPGDWHVILRGLVLVPTDRATRVYWRHDWVTRRIYLSGFHLARETVASYADRLRAWAPKILAGYPSNLFALARFMEAAGMVAPVPAIFTSSEVVTPVERAVIERQFAGKVWDRYGTGERLVVSQQCEHGRYHQNVEYGLLQVDDECGEPCAPGAHGRLIHTGLTNLSMPLIRYVIEDMGHTLDDACPCGRGLPLMGPVTGRKDDVILTADGRLMPRAGLDQIHEFVDNLERCQLVQERPGAVTVRVLPRPGFNAADEAELKRQLARRLGPDTQIEIELVEALELTPTGKERFIISRLAADAFMAGLNG